MPPNTTETIVATIRSLRLKARLNVAPAQMTRAVGGMTTRVHRRSAMGVVTGSPDAGATKWPPAPGPSRAPGR